MKISSISEFCMVMIVVTLREENVVGIKCPENPKIRALCEFKVVKS